MINKKLLKKLLLFLLIFLLLPFLVKCSMFWYKDNLLFNERIGEDFLVTWVNGEEEINQLPTSATNYNCTKPNANTTIITFDKMNATDLVSLTVQTSQKIRVNTDFTSGTVVLKMTQGDLNKTKIEKIEFINGETKDITLSNWDSGQLSLWFVVTDAENGFFKIELVD